MHALRRLLVLVLLLAAPLLPVRAATGNPDAHRLAAAFLDMMRIDVMMPQLLTASRSGAVALIERSGKTEQQAGEIFDTFMLPEFRGRLPELRARFEDILVEDFTVPELQAIVDNVQNDARRSAAAKAPQLQAQFTTAGQAWGSQVGRDVYAKNVETFKKLGLDMPNGAAQ